MPELQPLSKDQIDSIGFKVEGGSLNRQLYESQPRPFEVEVFKHTTFKDANGGYFTEVARFDGGNIQALKERGIEADFSRGQVSFSRVACGTERFGHVHPDQDELWYVSTGVLSMGLLDLRVDSPTEGQKYKLIIPEGTSLYIPHGVVHGFGNYGNEPVNLFYFPSYQFRADEKSQELRFISDDPTFWDFVKPDKI